MKTLFDENIAHALRPALAEFNPFTVQYMGWSGLTNGELLSAAEAAGFMVFVTGDKTVQFENDMRSRKIAVVSLSAPHWPLVKNHVAKIAAAVASATPGSFTRIDCGVFSRRRQRPPNPSLG